MARRSVAYNNMIGIRDTEESSVLELRDGLAKVKAMAEVSADRSYKNGRKRKVYGQTVELVMHLGIDPRQADQALRGALSFPKGIGKSRSVIAFCDADMAAQAIEAGAVEAGSEELVNKIMKGWLDFDVAVAHPSMMGQVGKLGRVLGPHGKMPTPKAGTVTPDVITAVREFTAGRVEFRNDSGGNIHLAVGKVGFSVDDLTENIEAAVNHISKIKPASTKGQFFKRISLCATNTPSVTVNVPV